MYDMEVASVTVCMYDLCVVMVLQIFCIQMKAKIEYALI